MTPLYCPECGARLEVRPLEGEGTVPYCPSCQAWRFPRYNTAVSMIVRSVFDGRILLIQQYGRPRWILVAGYVNPGESLEAAARREVLEETGLHVTRVQFNRSEYFPPSDTLMCNFVCEVQDLGLLHPNQEVDTCAFFTPEKARQAIFHGSLAERFLLAHLDGVPDSR
ncbi:MAG: NUDIX domain-containing protein [Clostridia bacterium]|nr:NUDIX domain-containing protein [Clostridia bacterium]